MVRGTKIPNVAALILQRLGRTLVRDKPEPATVVVLAAHDRLVKVLDDTDEALATRFRERNPLILATAREFDISVDTGWVWLRKLLVGYRDFYGHSGLDALSPELADQVGLTKLRHKAKLASQLHDRLFGADGTKWVKRNWIVQAETMATLLRVIETDGLHEQLDEVGAGEIVEVLRTLQVHYEEVVAQRMSQKDTPNDDFNHLRARLRWHIAHYQAAVETMRDPDEPESFEIVDRALRSIGILSARMAAAPTTEQLDELLDQDAFEPAEIEIEDTELEVDDVDELAS